MHSSSWALLEHAVRYSSELLGPNQLSSRPKNEIEDLHVSQVRDLLRELCAKSLNSLAHQAIGENGYIRRSKPCIEGQESSQAGLELSRGRLGERKCVRHFDIVDRVGDTDFF